jgi:hypothetical protein
MVSHLAEHHIPRTTLSRLVANGRLVQVSRGLYALPSHSRSEKHHLAEIAARSPKGVFCLLTALRFHELTTQSPHEIWMVQHGVPLNTVRDLLGHSSVAMSLRYAHLAPDQRKQAVAKLNDKPLLALTMRLPWNGFQNAAPYAFDVIGGKGGNRTLDPGIMSAVL